MSFEHHLCQSNKYKCNMPSDVTYSTHPVDLLPDMPHHVQEETVYQWYVCSITVGSHNEML